MNAPDPAADRPAPTTKKAYATLLCNGDGYVTGAEVLGKSLAASGSTIPRVAMVTADISAPARRRLEAQGWEPREVEPIANPTPEAQRVFARFAAVYTKLRAWELTGFDRVVLLDSDTLVLKNVDELFDRPGFAAAPDFFLPDRFNSGVMVIPPSQGTFDAMVKALAASNETYDGGDQGFLNTFYPNWYGMAAEHRLPVGYNVANFIYQFANRHPSMKATLAREAKILHYMVQKPWQATATLTGGAEAWWGRFFEVHPEKAHAWRDKVHAFEDWTFDTLAALFLE
jgi:lipopolysaccharide biosynthesis glycosyltransferase